MRAGQVMREALNKDVRNEAIAVTMIGIAAAIGGLATYVWGLVRGVELRQEFEQEMRLRTQEFDRRLELDRNEFLRRVQLERLHLLQSSLESFANEIPRNMWYLRQVRERQLWQSRFADSLDHTPAMLRWLHREVGLGPRYVDGSAYHEVSTHSQAFMDRLYEGRHYTTVCALARSHFGSDPAVVAHLDLIRDGFELLNEIAFTASNDQGDRQLLACAERLDALVNRSAANLGWTESSAFTVASSKCRGWLKADPMVYPADERFYEGAMWLLDGCMAGIDRAYYRTIDFMTVQIDQLARASTHSSLTGEPE